MPAADGLIPATVDGALLRQANALAQFSRQAGQVLGPTVATTLVVAAGPGWAFVLDAATFAVSVGALARLRVSHTPAATEGFLSELASGWTEMRRHRWYWANLVVHAVWNLTRACYTTLGPLVAVTALGGRVSWGTISQGGALGAVAGALLAHRLRPRRPLRRMQSGPGDHGLPRASLALHAPAALVAVSSSLAFGGLTYMNTLWLTLVQQRIPARALSRVMAYDWLTSPVLTLIGLAVAGPLGAVAGVSSTLLGAAVLVVAASLLVLAVPQVRMAFAAAPSGEAAPGEPVPV